MVQTSGQELKLVFPQEENEAQPDRFTDLDFEHLVLQPLDAMGDETVNRHNVEAAARYCLEHPAWSLGLQTHKVVGLP